MTPLAHFWSRLPFVARLLVTASVALVVAGAAMLLVSAGQEAREIRGDLDAELARELEYLPASLAEVLVIGDFATLQQSLDRFVLRPNVEMVRYRDASGVVLDSRDRAVASDVPQWFRNRFGFAAVAGTTPIEVGGRRYGQLDIELTADRVVQRAWHRLLSHLGVLLLAVALDFLGIWLVLRSGLKPLRLLDRGATALARGDLDTRIDAAGSPEFLRTIGAFNRMAEAVREARDSLAHEKEHLQVTLGSIGDAVIAADADGLVEFMNPVAEALTGWSSAEAHGRPLDQVFHIVNETTRAEVECPVITVFRQGSVVGLANHTLLIARDGSERPIADSAAPIRDAASGEIHGAVLVFRDQTEERQQLARLEASEARLREIFRSHHAVLLLIDPDSGIIVDANPAAERFYGYSLAQLRGMPISRINTLPEPEVAAERARAVRLERNHFIFRHRLADGAERIVEVYSSPALVQGRSLLFSIIHDITDSKLAEARLRLLAGVFEHAHDGIIVTDAEARIVDVNAAFTTITGYGKEEVVGRRPRFMSSGRHDHAFYDALWHTVRNDGFWHGEIWNQRKSGEVYPELLTITAVPDADGHASRYIGIFSDITTLKAQQQRLEQLANYDALTQLPNRVLLGDRLQIAMAQARRSGGTLAVCYLDLDGFKPINDNHGHEAGDRLLVEMARRLRGTIRAGDTVARMGGDEFVLLLAVLGDNREFEVVLSRTLQVIAQPYRIGDLTVGVSASIGVTFYPQHDAEPDALLRHADQAMYQAKQGGRNRFHVFDAALDRQVQAQRETVDRVATGLAAGEFLLYYQPKVDMRRGEVIGAEALIRWQHPERGLLLPGEFLPLVDESEVSLALGNWVIREALGHIRDWRAAGMDLTISINISACHLQNKDFVVQLQEHLRQHAEVPPGRLELEVLETAAFSDIAGVISTMERCCELGVGFALDDFGTGYSSLTYFRRLPAELLKIDQSFVRNMLRDPEDLAIVEGVIGLTKAFHRRVIAEGVETREHGLMLILLGCDLGQGFGIARPMPAADLPDWVRRYQSDPAWRTASDVDWSRQNLSLLRAEVEHRRWADDLIAYARGGGRIGGRPPIMDPGRCQFGVWLDASAHAAYGTRPEFAAVALHHAAIHAFGNRIVDLVASGERDQALQLTGELLERRGKLVEAFHALFSVTSRREAMPTEQTPQ